MKYLAAALLAVLAMHGCKPGSSTPQGELFSSFSDVKPNAKLPENANLKLADMDISVSLKQSGTDTSMILQLEAFGQLFEQESYTFDSKQFGLIDAAGETYNPAIPLLRFPMNVGESWKWSGTMTAGEKPHDASAQISTSTDQLLIPGLGSVPSILVVVDLSIDSGGPTPATRKLRFWFVKDKGLLKRQFGIGSTREPKE